MELSDLRTGMVALDREKCLALLERVAVGRVAVVIGGGPPQITPVNFALLRDGRRGDAIVFRTDAGTKLRGVDRGRVAFEADEFDPTTRSGWSVVVHGEAERIDAPPPAIGVDPWAEGDKPYWVRLDIATITGRRVG